LGSRMLAGKLRNLFKWVRAEEEKTVEAIIIEVHGVTTVPTTLTTSDEPLREPCSFLIITSEEVVRDVKYERGTGYPLPPPKSLPSPDDKLYNSRIILNCFLSIPRSEKLIESVRDLLGKLGNAFKPREVFARIIYTDGSNEYVSP